MLDPSEIEHGVPLSAQTARILRRQILGGGIEPGSRLNEALIAETLRISRAPVREALQQLAREGIVVHKLRGGAYIPKLNVEQTEQLYELREALETMAARLASTRSSAEGVAELNGMLARTKTILGNNESVPYPSELDFHLAVAKLSCNTYISDRIGDLNLQLQLLRTRGGYTNERAQQAYHEHVAVVEAIKNGDEVGAQERMRTHIRNSAERALHLREDEEKVVQRPARRRSS